MKFSGTGPSPLSYLNSGCMRLRSHAARRMTGRLTGPDGHTSTSIEREHEMMIKDPLRVIVAGTFLTAAIRAQAPVPRRAAPVEPIAAILEAFRSHPIVALGNV